MGKHCDQGRSEKWGFFDLWFQRARGGSWRLRAHILSHKQRANWKGYIYPQSPLPTMPSPARLYHPNLPTKASSSSGFEFLTLWGSLVIKPSQNPPAGKCPEQIEPYCRRQAGATRVGQGPWDSQASRRFPSRVMKNILEPDSGSAVQLRM